MIRMIATPKMKSGAPGCVEMCVETVGRYLMNSAPSTIPGSEPSPPTTAPTSSVIESRKLKLSGVTISRRITKSEPATPA